MTGPLRHVRHGELQPADPTPGMRRERAFETDGLWSGLVHTDAGMTSGWHHHGEYETSLYVVTGRMRLESGPGGRDVIDAGPGDFVYVPKGAVHRESNPADHPATVVISRAGAGAPTVNVDGPEPA